MSNPNVPWSVKGIPDDIRAIAKKQAQQSGMTMGAWLSNVIAAAESGQLPSSTNATLESGTAETPVANAANDAFQAELLRLVLVLAKRVASLEKDTVQFAAAFQDQLSDMRRSLIQVQQEQLEDAY